MERIAALHSRLQLTISAVLAILVIWGLISALRGQVGRGYIAAMTIAQLLIMAQGLLGFILLVTGGQVGRLGLHIVYGVVAMVCLPAAYLYNRGRATRWEALVFAVVCLFLLGIVIRAFETAV